jgi:hypothetical protein
MEYDIPIANYNKFITRIKNGLNPLNQTKIASHVDFLVELYRKILKNFLIDLFTKKTGTFEKNFAFNSSVLFTILQNICIGSSIKLTLIRQLKPIRLTNF